MLTFGDSAHHDRSTTRCKCIDAVLQGWATHRIDQKVRSTSVGQCHDAIVDGAICGRQRLVQTVRAQLFK